MSHSQWRSYTLVGVLAHRQSNLESSATQKRDTDALVGVLEIAVKGPGHGFRNTGGLVIKS